MPTKLDYLNNTASFFVLWIWREIFHKYRLWNINLFRFKHPSPSVFNHAYVSTRVVVIYSISFFLVAVDGLWAFKGRSNQQHWWISRPSSEWSITIRRSWLPAFCITTSTWTAYETFCCWYTWLFGSWDSSWNWTWSVTFLLG